jgi:hypothetical protein
MACFCLDFSVSTLYSPAFGQRLIQFSARSAVFDVVLLCWRFLNPLTTKDQAPKRPLDYIDISHLFPSLFASFADARFFHLVSEVPTFKTQDDFVLLVVFFLVMLVFRWIPFMLQIPHCWGDGVFEGSPPISKIRAWQIQRDAHLENVCKASVLGKMEWVLCLVWILGSSFIWVFLWIFVGAFYAVNGLGTFVRIVLAEPAWLLGHLA